MTTYGGSNFVNGRRLATTRIRNVSTSHEIGLTTHLQRNRVDTWQFLASSGCQRFLLSAENHNEETNETSIAAAVRIQNDRHRGDRSFNETTIVDKPDEDQGFGAA